MNWIPASQLNNAHLNGLLHSRLYGEEVKYLTNGQLMIEYEPGSEPVYKDVDFGWIPVPNYAGDAGDAQFLRYALAKHYKFIIEPHENQISVTCWVKDSDPGNPITACNAVEVTEARATAVSIYTMIEVSRVREY